MANTSEPSVDYVAQDESNRRYAFCLREKAGLDGTRTREWTPWGWTLYFQADDLALIEQLTVDGVPPTVDGGTGSAAAAVRSIRATLRPDVSPGRCPPSYSMIGVDQSSPTISLVIEPTSDEKDERCRAYGNVGYTTEIDFRDETIDDAVTFHLYIHAGRFDRYADRILSGAVDRLDFHARGVEGFYSEWTPAITTDRIAILTANRDHKVGSVPEGVSALRLGRVEEAGATFIRSVKFEPAEPEAFEPPEDESEDGDDRSEPVDPLDMPRSNQADKMVGLLTSLQAAAWVIAALLLFQLIF